MVRLRKGLLLLMLLALTASAAHATHFDGDPVLAVDCEGWLITGGVYFGSAAMNATVHYEVILRQAGSVVVTHAGEQAVPRNYPDRVATFVLDGAWPGDLCGDYTVDASLLLTYDDEGPDDTFAAGATLTCDCPPPPPPGWCPRTPGFWKNHANDWPVTTLVVGGVEYDQAAALMTLDASVRGDATVILFKHLVAAMLNVLAGGDAAIQPVVDEADAYLMAHPLGSRPTGMDKEEGLALKDALMEYNETPCLDDEDDLDGGDPMDKAMATEPRSWSAVKDTYR